MTFGAITMWPNPIMPYVATITFKVCYIRGAPTFPFKFITAATI